MQFFAAIIVSYDPSKIILLCLFSKECFLRNIIIINVENSWNCGTFLKDSLAIESKNVFVTM